MESHLVVPGACLLPLAAREPVVARRAQHDTRFERVRDRLVRRPRGAAGAAHVRDRAPRRRRPGADLPHSAPPAGGGAPHARGPGAHPRAARALSRRRQDRAGSRPEAARIAQIVRTVPARARGPVLVHGARLESAQRARGQLAVQRVGEARERGAGQDARRARAARGSPHRARRRPSRHADRTGHRRRHGSPTQAISSACASQPDPDAECAPDRARRDRANPVLDRFGSPVTFARARTCWPRRELQRRARR